MGFFSKILGTGSSSSDYYLSLDIGTEVVKALVFKVDAESGTGIIKGVGRARQGLKDMHSGAVSDISGVIGNCRQAIDLAVKMAGIKKVEKAIVGIAGELVKGTTTTVHYERINSEIRIEISSFLSLNGGSWILTTFNL